MGHRKFDIRYLPVYGCISTGMIYLGIGVVAILSLLRLKDGGADESSLLAFLNEYTLGKIFIWIILVGTLCYIVWRIYEAFADPYQYGKSGIGILKRIGIGLSTVADILIVYSAVEILLGISGTSLTGKPEEQQEMARTILQTDSGKWILILIGAIIVSTAAVQFFYGVTRGYKERLDISHMKPILKTSIHFLAWTGYLARGIIIGIIGFFFIKAGIVENARHVVNTDKAFDFIGDNVGHVVFFLVAVGTICYAMFMFSLGMMYDAEKD